ncbi:MAG: RDD family protein [Colwelliaceae bacterium]|nr:RDD family protein [Colwelliaceae bacterium]
MSLQKNTSSEPHLTNMLSEEETKKILTPFAFEIDKSLFGLPLAVPWKRGVALMVDFFFIFLLVDMPGELLAFVVAITFFMIGSKKRAEKMGKKRGLRKLFLRILGTLILFIVLITTIPDLIDNFSFNAVFSQNDQSSIVAKEDIDSNSSLDTKEVNEDSNTAFSEGVEWGKGVIDDLGLSFGWAAFYFTIFTALWNGQTPGKKTLKIKVIQLDGTPLSISDSFGRYGGYAAGLATGFLGFLQIYWDPNRQAIHDKISSTIVIDMKKH